MRVIAAWLECFPEKPRWCRNEQVCQGRKSAKRFERSNGLDTALYRIIPLPINFILHCAFLSHRMIKQAAFVVLDSSVQSGLMFHALLKLVLTIHYLCCSATIQVRLPSSSRSSASSRLRLMKCCWECQCLHQFHLTHTLDQPVFPCLC